jgi:DNA-binding NtrC family response regulator
MKTTTEKEGNNIISALFDRLTIVICYRLSYMSPSLAVHDLKGMIFYGDVAMNSNKILIAEDDTTSRENLLELLTFCGYEVTACTDGEQALDAFVQDKYELVITDLKMPRMGGLELLKLVKEINPDCIAIIMTGYGTISSAVEAMKLGAFDYIIKPLNEDIVKLAVERAISYVHIRDENVLLKTHLHEKYDFGKLIGYSEVMLNIFETIKKVSASDSTVLIHGESGTGKELVARAIHFNSSRKDQNLVAVNCGAIPEELLESELFGHEKGAFTGAIRNRIGRFELAHGGTILLDEIGDMSPALQVKLLRIIQEKQFERIGGMKTIPVDVRIIAATNQNLEVAVEEKRFREDLFYRINVIPIHIPPLRVRKIDIPILANHFLAKFNQSNKKAVNKINPDVIDVFMRYPWPGNIRELQNLMERIVVIKESGDICMNDIPVKMLAASNKGVMPNTDTLIPEDGINFYEEVINFEKKLLLAALNESGGVKNAAAKLLMLNRTTLVEKIKRYNILTA